MTDTPLSKEHELHAQVLMDSIWDVVAQNSQMLSAHEIIGILEVIQQKIGFDHNVRAANEEVKKMRQAQSPPNQSGPSPIIDKHGFPLE